MRKLILILLLFVSAVVNGQTPAGYIKANMRFKWTAGIFDSALHVPQYSGTPSGTRNGAWVGDGAVAIDTVNNLFYFRSGGSWHSTSSGSGTVTSVGLSLPSEFNVSGSPVTTSGTLGGAWANQTAYQAFRRGSGTGVPSFGSLDSNYWAGNFAAQVRNNLSAGTGLSYNSTTGVFTNTVTTTDTSNKWVNRIYRTPGIDSFYYQIGSTVYAVKDSAGGGGSVNVRYSIVKGTGDSLQLENDELAPGNDMFYGTTSEGAKQWIPQSVISGGSYSPVDSVGDVLSYSWANNPLSTWVKVGSSSVITTGGGITNISGGSTYNDALIYPGKYFGAENYTISQLFVPKNRSDTSIGFAIQLLNECTSGGLMTKFNLSDTAGYLSLHTTNTNASKFTSNQGVQFFSWVANDTLKFSIKRRKTKLIVNLENVTQKTNIYLDYTYITTNTSGPILNCESNLYLYFLGGSYDFIDTLHYYYDEPSRPKFVVLGNSITTGYSVEFESQRFAEKIFEGLSNNYVVSAGPGERASSSEIRVKNDLLRYFQPENAIFSYGVNDVNGLDNKDSASARYERTIQSLLDSCTGNVYVVAPFPQATNVSWMIDTLSAICTRTGAIFLNDYSLLKDTTTYTANSLYKSSDGVHPNELGHYIIGSFIRKRLQADGLLDSVYQSNEKYNNLPLVTNPKYLTGIDDKNNLIAYKLNIPDSASLNLGNYVLRGGNTNASDLTIGTLDNYNFIIKNNGNITGKLYTNYAARFGESNYSGTIGSRSFSAGNANTTSGISASTLGQSNTASANFATAFGYNNTAGGQGSIAGGYQSIANGSYSIALGNANTANGSWDAAISGRNLSTNSKLGAFIIGDYTGGGSAMTSDVNDQFKGRFAGGWRFNIDNSTTAMEIDNVGSIGMGTTSPNTSAKLDIQSTSKGFLPPRMTGAQAEAISSPAEGLMIYSTDGSGSTITTKGWWGYDGSTWVKLN